VRATSETTRPDSPDFEDAVQDAQVTKGAGCLKGDRRKRYLLRSNFASTARRESECNTDACDPFFLRYRR
jgi:hypothetical protein